MWRAFDRKEHRYCAAKLLRQRDAGDLLRFVREQSVRLDHPHIVSPYSWVAEDGTVLIASGLMTGGSLHTLIGDYGPLAESTVISVLRQVFTGLQAVHDAELIHRDVKPANILLRATGTGPLHVVLTDFGLTISRLDARLTQVGMVIGTPGYVPPEVLSGGVPPDPRHDLYAVGRLALTLIAGAEPTGGLLELIASIQDRSLRRAVEALLRPDPDERPDDAASAAVLLAGSPVDRTPRTRDGDPIEVLDQLPELPPGWGPDGPVDLEMSRSARAAPRATILDVAVTAPTLIPEHPPPVSGGSTRGRGRILAAAVAVATVVAGLVLAVWLLPGTSTTNPTDPPATIGTSAGSATPPASVGQATPIPPGTATLRAGDGCTWQQEGDRRTDIDGAALVCTLADGSYQWRSPG